MDSSYQSHNKSKKNRNTPCRRRRNARRAEEYRDKLKHQEIGTQTDSLAGCEEEDPGSKVQRVRRVIPVDFAALNSGDLTSSSVESEEEEVPKEKVKGKKKFFSRSGFWSFLRGKKSPVSSEVEASHKKDKVLVSKLEQDEGIVNAECHDTEGVALEIPNQVEIDLVDSKSEDNVSDRNIVNVSEIYDNFENTLRLSRLEERNNLTVALRHIVRSLHPKGETITFSSPGAVDRLDLRSINLPTEPGELLSLVKQVFVRRNEKLELEEVYRDFVKSHGRVAFDSKREWPHSHVHTHHP